MKREKQLLLRLSAEEKQNIVNYAKSKKLNINQAIVNLIESELKNGK